MFQGSFQGVYKMFQGSESEKGVSMKFHKFYKDDSGKFQGGFNTFIGISRVF